MCFCDFGPLGDVAVEDAVEVVANAAAAASAVERRWRGCFPPIERGMSPAGRHSEQQKEEGKGTNRERSAEGKKVVTGSDTQRQPGERL